MARRAVDEGAAHAGAFRHDPWLVIRNGRRMFATHVPRIDVAVGGRVSKASASGAFPSRCFRRDTASRAALHRFFPDPHPPLIRISMRHVTAGGRATSRWC